jgi:DMSO reductase family type II enzyme heme b subunit
LDADDAELLDPMSGAWSESVATDVQLDPTPITAQPSMYVQAKWKQGDYGQLGSVSVKAVHNDERIYFRLEWDDPDADDGIRNTDQFADAAAVLFPVADDAPLQSMGSADQPVNAWYWRPDLESPYSITAQGTSTTRRTTDPELGAQGAYSSGRWSVVVRRKFESTGDGYVQLAPGETRKAAFGIWQGANKERGGLKATTMEWQPLEIEG